MRGAVVVLGAALVAAGCGDAGDEASAFPAVVLPVLSGFDQSGVELDTDGLDGPAVINFWATWCPPCRNELPAFQRASEDHPGVRFVGVDEGFDAGESVEFLGELGVTYEQFVDRDGELADELEIVELPATVVLDTDGTVVLRHSGELSYDELVEAIAELG